MDRWQSFEDSIGSLISHYEGDPAGDESPVSGFGDTVSRGDKVKVYRIESNRKICQIPEAEIISISTTRNQCSLQCPDRQGPSSVALKGAGWQRHFELI